MISPLAYVDPSAQIGENVEIGPFCFIDKNVVIGDNNIIMPHVNIMYGSRIGNGNQIHPGAVIGGIPQDLKFRGEDTTAEIGDNNRIRENVTINRGTASKGKTVVGSNLGSGILTLELKILRNTAYNGSRMYLVAVAYA